MNPRRLYRCRTDRKLAGVAAGMAEYLEMDPTVVRVLWILSALFGGFTILLYIILAFVMPLEPFEMAATGPTASTGDAEGAAGTGDPAARVGEWQAHRHDHVGSGPAGDGRDGHAGRAGIVLGTMLVVFGAIALAGPLLPGWAASVDLGPAFVLALGVALLAGSIRRPAAEP